MRWQKRREAMRALIAGDTCVRPASVYDPISARIAEDLGFEFGILGGSTASLAVLGDPDLVLLTLSELAEQVRRMSQASALPVFVDADHGFGNALNVRRTVAELEAGGAAGLSVEDTLLPRAYGAKTQLISTDEAVGKLKVAVDARSDPNLIIASRTGTRAGGALLSTLDDCIARAKAFETTGVDALFFVGFNTRAELQVVAAATKLPIVLGVVDGELDDPAFLAAHRVKFVTQGHAPIFAATQAVYDTMKALRDGTSPKQLKGLASGELVDRVTREADVKRRNKDFLGG